MNSYQTTYKKDFIWPLFKYKHLNTLDAFKNYTEQYRQKINIVENQLKSTEPKKYESLNTKENEPVKDFSHLNQNQCQNICSCCKCEVDVGYKCRRPTFSEMYINVPFKRKCNVREAKNYLMRPVKSEYETGISKLGGKLLTTIPRPNIFFRNKRKAVKIFVF